MTRDEAKVVQALVDLFTPGAPDPAWDLLDAMDRYDRALAAVRLLLSQPEEPRTTGVKWEVETRMNGGRTYAAIYSTLPGVETPSGSYPLLIARCQDERDAELIVRAVNAAPQPEEEPGREVPPITEAQRAVLVGELEKYRISVLEEAAKAVEGRASGYGFEEDRYYALMKCAAAIRSLAEAKRGSAK